VGHPSIHLPQILLSSVWKFLSKRENEPVRLLRWLAFFAGVARHHFKGKNGQVASNRIRYWPFSPFFNLLQSQAIDV